jgi:hypothetical protein
VSRSATPPAAAGKPRKSPLRLGTVQQPSFPSPASRDGRLSPQQLRAMMISEFEQRHRPTLASGSPLLDAAFWFLLPPRTSCGRHVSHAKTLMTRSSSKRT